MLTVVLWIAIFGGLFVVRAIVATIVFFYLLPEGDRCPNCDAVTLRVESRGWNFLLPRCRSSWCIDCGWHGLLRAGPLSPTATEKEVLKYR